MSAPIKPPEPPALALDIAGACAALNVSHEVWHKQIEPEIKLVRIGRLKRVPVTELQRWLEAHAEAVLG